MLCFSVQDPCAEHNGGCMHMCHPDGGKAHCDCNAGYILAEDGKTCEGKITSDQTQSSFKLIMSQKVHKETHMIQEVIINGFEILNNQSSSAIIATTTTNS